MMEQCKENETMRNYKITVAGTGYVGLSIATLLSQHHQVTAVDIVPEKVELINNRKCLYVMCYFHIFDSQWFKGCMCLVCAICVRCKL